MKKVWILEKFETAEDARKVIEEYKQLAARPGMTEDQIGLLNTVIANQESRLEQNPEGYWYGFEGKIFYNQFVSCAKAAIHRNPEGKFRVVEAEIDDDAWTWMGYKAVKVNDGAMAYIKKMAKQGW